MGGAQLSHDNWTTIELSLNEKDNGANMQQFDIMKDDEDSMGESKNQSSDPFQWEDESNNSQGSNSMFQNSMDESSRSQADQNGSLFNSPEQSPALTGSSGGQTGKERLIIKFRRISQRYYMVEETHDSSCLNYGLIRTQFEDYGVPPEMLPPKVHRCKTCRKVFDKVSNLRAHSKTHPGGHKGFDKSQNRGFTAADFAKRFSTDKMAKDPTLILPSEYAEILSKCSPHPREYSGYVNLMDLPMPYLKAGQKLTAGDDEFQVHEVIGEGGFARVFSATWLTGPQAEKDTVLKVQFPANDWEWYCLNQVHTRFSVLSHPLKKEDISWECGFMSTPRCFTYMDGSIMNTQHQRMGTLLDLVNLTKNSDKIIIEPIAIYLTAELLGLVEMIHSMKIVHADIKPDNFLLNHTPSTRSECSLQLIDFGKAIDLELEDEKPIENGNSGRQGKYHLDYFGIAGSAFCLLFGKYIEVGTVKNRWVIKGNFKRWWQVKVWTRFFDDMLNPKGDEKEYLPSLLEWRKRLLDLFEENDELKIGLTRAKETIEMKYMEKWRRSAL